MRPARYGHWLAFVVALPLCLCASRSGAQASTGEVYFGHLTLDADLGYYQSSQAHESLDLSALRLDGEYALDPRWSIAGRVGILALGSSPEVGDGDFVVCLGNPALMFYRRGEWRGGRYRLGAGGAGPLAVASREQTGRLRRTAYNTAAGMSGLWDLWLWAPSRGAIMLDAQVDLHVIHDSWLLLEFEPALYIPARDLFLDVPVEVVLPVAATFGPRYRSIWVGMRTQAVFRPTSGGDALQLSLGPWLRANVGCGYLEASYVGNVGEPMAGARGPGIWGLHVGGGGAL